MRIASLGAPLRQKLEAAIAAGTCGHYAPLLRAALNGCPLIGTSADERLDDDVADLLAKPRWALVLGDDVPGQPSHGPAPFDSDTLHQLAGRATYAAVYSGPVNLNFYALFGLLAELGSRLLIIETRLERHADWLAWIDRWAPSTPLLDIQPPAAGTA
jgi:hypothetical protein